jgi:hypothetical protein
MKLLSDITKTLSNFVAALPAKNTANRKEIREVVLSVQTEMERAIELSILYIDGATRIKPKNEFLQHLREAPTRLMDSYNEFKICVGLYGLADKFSQVFSTVRGSIHLTEIQNVEQLIRSLARGERIVMDGLRDITQTLADEARLIESLGDLEYDESRKQVDVRISFEVETLRDELKLFRKRVKEILKRL